MYFYIEKDGNQLEVLHNPNNRKEKSFEIVHIATIIIHQPGYEPKFVDMVERRWNLLLENRMREIREYNRKTGEYEHYLVPADQMNIRK